MSVVERILCKLFEYQDITDTETGELYLRRFFIFNTNRGPKKKQHVYLHHFYRGDNDRDLHDHPWDFYSLILKGGYAEETAHYVKGSLGSVDDTQPKRYIKWYGPGSFLRRPATWTHCVKLPKGKTAWTLVYTTKWKRKWGFHTPKGWCWWKNYENGICFCEDGNEQTA